MSDYLTKALLFADTHLTAAHLKAVSGFPLPSSLSASIGDSPGWNGQSQSSKQDHYACNKGAVYACTRLISSKVAAQPFCLGRKAKLPAKKLSTKTVQVLLSQSLPSCYKAMANNLEPIEQHPLLDLLDDPNEFLGEGALKSITAASLELTGRALWLLDEDASGKRSIYFIPTGWITEVDWTSGVWTIRVPGASKDWDIPSERLANFYYPSPADPREALSPLEAIGSAVYADEQIQVAQNKAFGNGLYPGLALHVGATKGHDGQSVLPHLTKEQRQQLISSVLQAVGGVHKYGAPIILDAMIEKISQITNKPDEMAFLDSSKITTKRIYQSFGVSPLLLGDIEGGNRAQATQAERIFYSFKVNPLLAIMSQAASGWLCPWYAKPNEKLVLWMPECVADDPELQIKRFGQVQEHLTINEQRAHAGYGPIAGGDILPTADRKSFANLGRRLKRNG